MFPSSAERTTSAAGFSITFRLADFGPTDFGLPLIPDGITRTGEILRKGGEPALEATTFAEDPWGDLPREGRGALGGGSF